MLLFRFTYVLTKHVQIVFWDLNKCLFIISSTRSEYEFTRQARFLCLKVQEKSSNKFSSNIRVRDITSVKLCWHEKFAPTFWLVRLQHPSKNLPSFGNKAFIFFEEFQQGHSNGSLQSLDTEEPQNRWACRTGCFRIPRGNPQRASHQT